MEDNQLTTPAKWVDDCQGKKNYDGGIVSVSTRYWPERHWPNSHVQKPSAKSSIILLHSPPDEDDYVEDRVCLAEQKFEGETEQDVKDQVELWVQTQMNRLVSCLSTEFSVLPNFQTEKK